MKPFSTDRTVMLRRFPVALAGATMSIAMAAAACGNTPSEASGADASSLDASPATATDGNPTDATMTGAGDSGATLYMEQTLTLELTLTIPAVTHDAATQANDAATAIDGDSGAGAGGAAPTDAGDQTASDDAELIDGGDEIGLDDAALIDGGVEAGVDDAAPIDAGSGRGPDDAATVDGGGGGTDSTIDSGSDAGAQPATTLTITARDGVTPVVTDLWLYTLDSQGNQTPLTGFTSTQPRKSPRLMLPATINDASSGLSPADNGNENGTMTCSCGSRGTLEQGAFVSTVTGTAIVTLSARPTAPILVVAGIEDQRYAGAAVVNPDGSPGTVPGGVGVRETHARVSFTTDVAPILKSACVACHTGQGPRSDAGAGVGKGYNANFYSVTGTADDLVNANFALNEQTFACETANPDGGLPLAQCIQAITQAQFLVEPGAPAASDLLQRARPDENAGTSALGLLWYGAKGGTQRYSATYGDRRMPSTTQATSADAGTWDNQPCYFDSNPAQYQVIYDWVAQGALSN